MCTVPHTHMHTYDFQPPQVSRISSQERLASIRSRREIAAYPLSLRNKGWLAEEGLKDVIVLRSFQQMIVDLLKHQFSQELKFPPLKLLTS